MKKQFVCVLFVMVGALSLWAQSGATTFNCHFGDELKEISLSGETLTASFRVHPKEKKYRENRAQMSAWVILEWQIPEKGISLESADSICFSSGEPFMWIWRTGANSGSEIKLYRKFPGEWTPLFVSLKVLPKDFRKNKENFEIDTALSKEQLSHMMKFGIPLPNKKNFSDFICRGEP